MIRECNKKSYSNTQKIKENLYKTILNLWIYKKNF